jgi:DNA-binding CsgD family transcriptional regulator/PAS domain-containing protein
MSDTEQVASLIGDIYDAALDPSRWTAVLRRTRDVVGGSAAVVFSKDARTKRLQIYHHCGGMDPHYRQLYFDHYEKLDPTTGVQVMSGIGEPIGTVDIMAIEDFQKTRFYQEWRRPQGVVDFVAAALDRTATCAVLFGVFRQHRHGFVDDDTRWRMRQIVPHIRRAILISKVIEDKTAEAATFADALDGLSAGMFVVDVEGRIVHSNASGQALLDDGAALDGAHGRIRPTDAAAARALKDVVAASGDNAARGIKGGIKGIAVPLTGSDGQRYAAHVLPLTTGNRRRTGARYEAVAAVFVRKAEIEAPSAPDIIAKHYQLTPTELRVLLAIVDIGGVRETSEALGIGEATVKTHLHRVFGKTGASRQADLVKLVASFSSPLAS